ncbi:putative addiction module antidote protein [soil metagenome]
MAIKLTTFDAADYLTTDRHIKAYLDAVLEENDPAQFQHALGTVARARGMQTVAGEARTTRSGLYKALSSSGNPEFATVLRVIDALGYRFKVVANKPAVADKRPRRIG